MNHKSTQTGIPDESVKNRTALGLFAIRALAAGFDLAFFNALGMFGRAAGSQSFGLTFPVFALGATGKSNAVAQPCEFGSRHFCYLVKVIDAQFEHLLFNRVSNAVNQSQVVRLAAFGRTQQPLGLFTQITNTGTKYTLLSSITTQQPPRPPKTTQIAFSEA
ncbi:MAG: hypothetical protein AAFR49_20460, partial [Pseudomonadota bacterium]